MDSKAVYEQRMLACGVKQPVVDLFIAANVDSMAKLAFACPSANGYDEVTFMALVKDVFTLVPDNGVLACLRRIVVESQTLMLAELKQRVERKESDEPRKVPAPERESRLAAQKLRLTGMELKGPLEPGHTLIDNVAQQREDEQYRYIDLEMCVARQDETRAAKPSKASAPLNSDLQIRQAFTRKNLAYDQMEIIPYDEAEKWTNFLFALPLREAPQRWQRVSMEQILLADKAMWLLASEECRAGITKPVGTRTYPMVESMKLAKTDSYIVSMLSPLPSSEHAAKRPKHDAPPEKYQRAIEPSPRAEKDKGKGKGKQQDEGKGKGKEKGKNDYSMPAALRGMYKFDKNQNPICYGYNLGGCEGAACGKACAKGLHICAKCLGEHCLNDCKQ